MYKQSVSCCTNYKQTGIRLHNTRRIQQSNKYVYCTEVYEEHQLSAKRLVHCMTGH